MIRNPHHLGIVQLSRCSPSDFVGLLRTVGTAKMATSKFGCLIMTKNDHRTLPATRGLRHVALKVSDVATSKVFYQKWFGMAVVWEPDAESVYMSTGVDNLALHQIPSDEIEKHQQNQGQFLDHLGFLMESPESVDQLYQQVVEEGVRIVNHPKQHRDGSYSFYLADPDHIVIQILYEPTISAIQFSS